MKCSERISERAGRQEPSPAAAGAGKWHGHLGCQCGGLCFRAADDPATPREVKTGPRSTVSLENRMSQPCYSSRPQRDPRGQTRSWQSHHTEKRSAARRDGRWGQRVRSHGPHVSRESGTGPFTPRLRFHDTQEPSRVAKPEQGCCRGGGTRKPSGVMAPAPVLAGVRPMGSCTCRNPRSHR